MCYNTLENFLLEINGYTIPTICRYINNYIIIFLIKHMNARLRRLVLFGVSLFIRTKGEVGWSKTVTVAATTTVM